MFYYLIKCKNSKYFVAQCKNKHNNISDELLLELCCPFTEKYKPLSIIQIIKEDKDNNYNTFLKSNILTYGFKNIGTKLTHISKNNDIKEQYLSPKINNRREHKPKKNKKRKNISHNKIFGNPLISKTIIDKKYVKYTTEPSSESDNENEFDIIKSPSDVNETENENKENNFLTNIYNNFCKLFY